MTDALARQSIQRWTAQLVPPEYLGAHVSAPFSHQTGRYIPMSLRGATALAGHFGIEWDLTEASDDDLAELAGWIALYKQHRGLIHAGRVVRVDESVNDQPSALRIPGLDPRRLYRIADLTPGSRLPRRTGLTDLAEIGLAIPLQQALAALVILIEAA